MAELGASLERRSYTIVRLVGQGTFGKVFEALDDMKRRVAIKRIEKNANFISREVDILNVLSHPNCIELKDVFYTYSEDHGNTKKYQNLVFDFLPFTLGSLLKKRRPSLLAIKSMFYQLCQSLAYIHSKKIAHRDITPNNVLVSSTGEVQLADFGSAKVLDDDHVSMSYICSRYYRAPELLMGSTTYTTKIDVWSAGCILSELLMGKPIFPGVDSQDQFVKIVLVLGTPTVSDLWAMKKNYKQNLRFPKIEPLWFGDILPAELTKAQQETIADLLSLMLCYNPKKRASMDEILNHAFFADVKEQMAKDSKKSPISSEINSALVEIAAEYVNSVNSSESSNSSANSSTSSSLSSSGHSFKLPSVISSKIVDPLACGRAEA